MSSQRKTTTLEMWIEISEKFVAHMAEKGTTPEQLTGPDKIVWEMVNREIVRGVEAKLGKVAASDNEQAGGGSA